MSARKPQPGRKRIYYSVADIARVMGLPHRNAYRWMLRAGVAVKIGGKYYTSRARLVEALPEIASLL